MTALHAERQAAIVKAGPSELQGLCDLPPNDAGMHLTGWLRKDVDDREACSAVAAAGVDVSPVSTYCIDPPSRGALRLGYTGYTTRQISQAARRLAEALR